MPKNGPFWRVFVKPKACGQTVLPDRSVLIGQKLVENGKIQKFKCDKQCVSPYMHSGLKIT